MLFPNEAAHYAAAVRDAEPTAPSLRSKAVKIEIANTDRYALRKMNPELYERVSGEFTKRKTATEQNKVTIDTKRDLKFRAIGEPIHAVEGLKELHLQLRGLVRYDQNAQLHDWTGSDVRTKPDTLTDEEWIRMKRYAIPHVLIDVEFWAQTRGALMPIRALTRTEIDTDWSANAPVCRVDAVALAQHYSSAITPDKANIPNNFWEQLAFYLGQMRIDINSALPIPVVQVSTLAPIVVPVVTMHIGGRSLGAQNIEARFELEGTAFYKA